MIYLFSLGRTIDLCFAELQAIFKINQIDNKILHRLKNHVMVEIKTAIDPDFLIKQSGGIVKIGKILTITNQCYQIVSNTNKKIFSSIAIEQYKNFGASIVGFETDVKKLCRELKELFCLHYILPKNGRELSSAQICSKKNLEIIIVKAGGEYFIFQTQAVQDVAYWVKKDAGRPFIDDRLGMLPLKVARMMINISRGGLGEKRGIDGLVIADPFCGMGSILQEGVDLGFQNVIGGDINAQVLEKCRENLNWFQKTFNYENAHIKLIECDAAKISKKMQNAKIDLIVTEPFLGDAGIIQKLNLLKIKNIIKGLSKMYLGALKDWKKILKNESAVCMIVPEIDVGGCIFTIRFLEMCEKLGYNLIGGPYEYAREKAIVKRKIFILKLDVGN